MNPYSKLEPSKEHGSLPRLGAVERETLEKIWSLGEVSVHDMVEAFGDKLAYTTVMTTLDRLFKKGFLTRRKVSRAYHYAAKNSRAEMELGIARSLIANVMDSTSRNAQPVLAFLVDIVSEHDRDLLDDLDRLIQEKRKEM